MKKFLVTNERCELVKSLTAHGIPQRDIAASLDISEPTLRKYFRAVISKAHIQANLAVGQTAYKMATSGNDTAMTIFWLKTRCGWKETNALEVTTPAPTLTELYKKLRPDPGATS